MTPERVKEEVKSILRRLRVMDYGIKNITTLTNADSPYTIESTFVTSIYFVDTTTGDVLIVLPRAQDVIGREWTFKKLVAANDVHLQPVESQLVDGNLTYTFSNQWECVTIISNGADFYVISQVN